MRSMRCRQVLQRTRLWKQGLPRLHRWAVPGREGKSSMQKLWWKNDHWSWTQRFGWCAWSVLLFVGTFTKVYLLIFFVLLCSKTHLASDEMSDCEKCSPTMYANDHISCQQCEGGQFLQTKGKRSCLSCPIGYFRGSKSNKADECPRCAKGYFSDIEASTGCDECDRGQYWDSKTASSFGRCHDCEAGKYQGSRGRLLCLDCPHGKLVRNRRGVVFHFFFLWH